MASMITSNSSVPTKYNARCNRLYRLATIVSFIVLIHASIKLKILSNKSHFEHHTITLSSTNTIDHNPVPSIIHSVNNELKTQMGIDVSPSSHNPSTGKIHSPTAMISESPSAQPSSDSSMLRTKLPSATTDTRSNTAPTLPPTLLSQLKYQFIEARKKYNALIKEKYGQYGDDIFGRSALLETISSPSPISSVRLKRRMKIKIIQAQISSDIVDNPVTFKWVSGGNSMSAGHGNLLSQSYTSVLEAAIEPLFAALGIKFYGKNYGMGGATSGPEISMCLNSIYGMDLDVLSWDFALTDGNHHWNYELWTQRAGVHRTKPSLFSIGPKHIEYNTYIESAGIATFTVGDVESSKIPNSDADDIDPMDLPSGLQYYMCSGYIEKGDDVCKENKWNTSGTCPTMKFQARWHSGWKHHQLVGNQLASYMVEQIFDALDELDASSTSAHGVEQFLSNNSTIKENEEGEIEGPSPSISVTYLEYLLSLEEKDKELFLASNVPQNNKKFAKIGPEVVQHFHRANAICHTSIIPAYARYEGLVTESKQNITYLYAGKTTYKDEGIGFTYKLCHKAIDITFKQPPHPQYENNATPPILGFAESDRGFCAHAQYDFRDSFIVRHEDNWMLMTVPNKAEKKAFSTGDRSGSTLGLIMICTNYFYGRFPRDFLTIPEIINAASPTGIVINGVNVVGSTGVTKSNQCHVLKHAGGYYFPEVQSGNNIADSRGEYNIEIRALKDSGTIYLSSVVVL